MHDVRQVLRASRALAIVLGLEEDWRALDESTHLNAGDVGDLLEAMAREVSPRRDKVDRVRELYGQGLNDPAIAIRLKISPSQVCRIRRKLGLPGLVNAKRSGWERRLREAHMYGLTPQEIAIRLHWTIGTVHTRSSALGLRANKSRDTP